VTTTEIYPRNFSLIQINVTPPRLVEFLFLSQKFTTIYLSDIPLRKNPKHTHLPPKLIYISLDHNQTNSPTNITIINTIMHYTSKFFRPLFTYYELAHPRKPHHSRPLPLLLRTTHISPTSLTPRHQKAHEDGKQTHTSTRSVISSQSSTIIYYSLSPLVIA